MLALRRSTSGLPSDATRRPPSHQARQAQRQGTRLGHRSGQRPAGEGRESARRRAEVGQRTAAVGKHPGIAGAGDARQGGRAHQ